MATVSVGVLAHDAPQQPLRAHQEWHTDVSDLNLGWTFYFLISVLDGYSRYLVHWEIRSTMKEQDIELVIQRSLPQSNGKIERWHGSLKRECIRPSCPETLEEARRRVEVFVQSYNHERLHSALVTLRPAIV